MKLFLHIIITNSQFNGFHNDVINQVKAIAGQVSIFDVDNFSDALTIQTAVKALKEAEKSLVFIESTPGSELKGILKLLQYFGRPSRPVRIIYSGSHDLINKMLPAFGDRIRKGDVKTIKNNLTWLVA